MRAPGLYLHGPRLHAALKHQENVILLHGRMLQRWCP